MSNIIGIYGCQDAGYVLKGSKGPSGVFGERGVFGETGETLDGCRSLVAVCCQTIVEGAGSG